MGLNCIQVSHLQHHTLQNSDSSTNNPYQLLRWIGKTLQDSCTAWSLCRHQLVTVLQAYPGLSWRLNTKIGVNPSDWVPHPTYWSHTGQVSTLPIGSSQDGSLTSTCSKIVRGRRYRNIRIPVC
jgi:fatty acid desaturase